MHGQSDGRVGNNPPVTHPFQDFAAMLLRDRFEIGALEVAHGLNCYGRILVHDPRVIHHIGEHQNFEPALHGSATSGNGNAVHRF